MRNVRTTDTASIAPGRAKDGAGGRSLGSRVLALAQAAAAIHMSEAATPSLRPDAAQRLRFPRNPGGGAAA